MVGGWDKSPGDDNNYASRPWTRTQTARYIGGALVVISVIVIIATR